MSRGLRWDPCVAHRGDEVDEFLASYFALPERKVFLVTGASFDPRSRVIADRLSVAATNLRALLVRETRPNPPQTQLDRAAANTKALCDVLVEQKVVSVEIFRSDGAVVGGRSVINVLNQQDLKHVTDVVVDISALSAGVSFPIIRYFVEYSRRNKGTTNLHVFVVHDPCLDAGIRSVESDAPGYIHGFRGGSTLVDTADAARLWLPQLATGRRAALERLYSFIEPHDTCPILPFPASDPRLGDVLAEEYLTEFENIWMVDARNIVYADERDPLDLYRTILRLDDLRKPVFANAGGSMLVLSPLGSKVMALGALMAALERDLPVVYLESIGYELPATAPEKIDQPDIMHLWLEGDAYPELRSELPEERSTAQ